MGKTFRECVHDARRTARMRSPRDGKEQIDRGGVTLIDVGEEWQLRDVSVIQGGCRGWTQAGFSLEPYPAPISGTASSRSNR
jgi:hypothetical protein